MIKVLAVTTLIWFLHDWYPPQCCSGHDCHPVPCGQLRRDLTGWVLKRGGAPDHFSVATPSPDEACHACFSAASLWEGRCLFMPQSSV